MWVYDCLDIIKPKMEMKDIIKIVEIISPDSYEELCKTIIINSVYIDPSDYYKHVEFWDKIISYMILSFENKDMKLYNEKCKLLEFMIERRN